MAVQHDANPSITAGRPRTLADLIAAGPVEPSRASILARQIAEELWAAHQSGLVHGSLTPSDIALVGSGAVEQAVITNFGNMRHAQFRDDIRAFGGVLEALQIASKLAEDCRSTNPSLRPDSMELVLEELQGIRTVRTWIGGLLIGAAASALYVFELSRPWMAH